MQINKHGSFYIRNGWPTKIIDVTENDCHIFAPNNELHAVDTLGVGRVMIKAMRYWSTALGISTESKDHLGIVHKLTDIGNMILNNDIYCTDIGTLWLLHRNLSINKDNATAWYWAFNQYENYNFTKEEFVNAFSSYTQKEGMTYVTKAIEKEFDCFKNTYVSDQNFSTSKLMEEDNVPFFAPLKLLVYKGKGIFEKRKIAAKEIPLDIFFAMIIMDNLKHLDTNKQISIDKLMEDECQVCKYANLSYSTLIELLQQLENSKYLRLINNFGNRYIEINDFNLKEILEGHYQMIGR